MALKISKQTGKIASFEAISRGAGNTLLHITEDGVVLASSQLGIILDIGWEELYTATLYKKKIILTWKSASSVTRSYGIKFRDPGQIMHAITAANKDHADKMTFLDSLRGDHAREISLATNKIRTDFGGNEAGWHPTQTPERFPAICIPGITPVVAARDARVPRDIPDKYVWNDAWYDDSKGYFLTHNPMLGQIEDLSQRPEQAKHRISSPDGSVSLEGFATKFLFGYPAVVLSWDGVNGHQNAWTLLSTIKPEMLTRELITAKIHANPSDHNLTYLTDPPGTYVAKFHAPISLHEAALYSPDMREYAITTYPDLVAQLNYLHENVPVPPIRTPAVKKQDVHAASNDANFLKWIKEIS